MESKSEDTDWAKTFEEMKDRVAELEKAVFGDKAAEETEELSKESTDLSTDVMGEIITRLNSMEEKFSGLENEPSNNGVNVSPSVNNNKEINLSKLSVKERVAYFVNKN